MREIKLRAWSRCGEWDDAEEKQAFQMIEAYSLAFEEFEPLSDLLTDIDDEFYLMQYTGLKDKNGKEIYEGDIVRFEDGEVLSIVWIDVSAGFGAKSPKYEAEHTIDGKRYEVIGNIYESPELLEGK